MYQFSRFLQTSLTILLVGAFVAACQAVTQMPLSVPPTPGISLNITGKTCPSAAIAPGDSITWTNQDQQVHLIHMESSQGDVIIDLQELKPGDTASLNFPQEGSYSYICSSDRGSTGTITVTETVR